MINRTQRAPRQLVYPSDDVSIPGPDSISGLVWWLRPDMGVSTTGGLVTSWADQSGVGDSGRNVAPGATDAPALNNTVANYNNQPTVGTFNKVGSASDCRLVTGTWSTSYAGNDANCVTLIVVGHAENSGNRYFTHKNGIDYLSIVNGSGTPTVYSGAASTLLSDGRPASSGALSTPAAFVMVEFNGTSSAIYVNSVSVAAQSGALTDTSLGTAAVFIGSYPGVSTSFGVEAIAEVIAFNKKLSSDERQTLRAYINNRYGKSMAD